MKKLLAMMICVAMMLGIGSWGAMADEPNEVLLTANATDYSIDEVDNTMMSLDASVNEENPVADDGIALYADSSGEMISGNYRYIVETDADTGEQYAVITYCTLSSTKITFPESIGGYTVRKIGAGEFVLKEIERTNLRSIVIPDTVTEIGECAFLNCSGLSSVKLSKNLTTLGSGSFWKCTALKTIEIPKSLTKGRNAFYESGLTNITFEEGTTQIANGLFRTCTSLTTIDIPDSVTWIDQMAFENCEKLSNVKLSKNLTTLGHNAFNNCPSLKTIEIPKSLTKGKGAFRYSGLTTVTFEESPTKILDGLFECCDNLSEFAIPDTVTEIENGAFGGCKK